MSETQHISEREIRIAGVLRPLGTAPMTRQQAERVGQLLGLHWSTVYKLRRRFLQHPVTSAVAPRRRGPKNGSRRIDSCVEAVVQDVLDDWLPRQRHLAHPLLDLFMEVRRRCHAAKLQPPPRDATRLRAAGPRSASFRRQPWLTIPPRRLPPAALAPRRRWT